MSGKSGGKRAPRAQTTPTVSAPPRGTPTCPACGFTGWPGPASTPYVGGCNGDQSNHVRPPVVAS